MTGFGRAELKTRAGTIRVEIKSVNHKFLEISPRLPVHLSEYEAELRRLVSAGARRGKVNVFVTAPDPEAVSAKLTLNEPLAREVHAKARRLRTILNVREADGAALLAEVLRYPNVLSKDASSNGRGAFTADLERAVRAAVKNFEASRLREGKALERDILSRLSEIEAQMRVIKRREPKLAAAFKTSLVSRMKELTVDGVLDRERLSQEVAQYVKNVDISEERVRLAAHVASVRAAVRESGELGRKIDFIGQEMTREANTMGSKSNDGAIANAVIAIKSAIEKIREQAQNIE